MGTALHCIRNSINDRSFLNELGSTILEIVGAIPGGILVFLPSRSSLEAAVQKWKEASADAEPLWARLQAVKGHVDIEGSGSDARNALERHVNAVASNSGSVLFCVYRGR